MRSVVFLLVAALAGCASTLRNTARDPAVLPEARASIDRGAASPRAEEPATVEASDSPYRTGSSFGFAALGDAQLASLVEEAVLNHRDVLAAIASVRQARALANQARAARLPTVAVTVTGSMGQSIVPGIGAVEARSINLAVPIAYEVDLFGRFAAEHRATRREADATEADVDAIAITIAAEVADAWFDLVVLGSRRASLDRQLALQRDVLALVSERARQGLAPNVDVLAQEQLIARTEVEIALLVGDAEVASNRLAILVGRMPSAEVAHAPDRLPEIAALDGAGVSAERIATRPDLRASLMRLESADARVSASVRAQLPSLRIAFTPGFTALRGERGGMTQSASGFTWNLNGTLTVPLFDGLRGYSIATERRARVEQLVREYEQRFLEAVTEAENAVVLERQARVRLEQLARLRDLARRTREATEASYRAGLTDYLRVLLALRDELDAELAFLDAQRAILSFRLQLFRALGGDLGF